MLCVDTIIAKYEYTEKVIPFTSIAHSTRSKHNCIDYEMLVGGHVYFPSYNQVNIQHQ